LVHEPLTAYASITPAEVAVGQSAVYSVHIPIPGKKWASRRVSAKTLLPIDPDPPDLATVQTPAFGELSVSGPQVSQPSSALGELSVSGPKVTQVTHLSQGASEGTVVETHSWTVKALKPGRFDIGPTRYVLNGKTSPLDGVGFLVDSGPPRQMPAHPGEISAQAFLDRSVIHVGESVTYSFRLSTDENVALSGKPGWGELLAAPPATVTQQEFVTLPDGTRTAIHWSGFEWIVVPPKSGHYLIDSPGGTVGGHSYTGPPVSLEVDDVPNGWHPRP
jgi:hypothetical protein